MKDLVLHSKARTWGTFSEVLWAMSLEWCWEEKYLTTWNCLRHCPHTLFQNIYRPDCVQKYWWHKICITALLFFISTLKAGDIITTRQYIKYQPFIKLQFRPWPKVFFIVITMTCETRAMKKIPLYLSLSLVLFLFFGNRPLKFSSLKVVTRWLLQVR